MIVVDVECFDYTRPLIDKVVLKKKSAEWLSVRIVWRGGAVSDLSVALSTFPHFYPILQVGGTKFDRAVLFLKKFSDPRIVSLEKWDSFKRSLASNPLPSTKLLT
jgi:hypothetical protein